MPWSKQFRARKHNKRAFYHDSVTDFFRWYTTTIPEADYDDMALLLLRRPDLLNLHMVLMLGDLGERITPNTKVPHTLFTRRSSPKDKAKKSLEWLGRTHYRRLVTRAQHTPMNMEHVLMFRRTLLELLYAVDPESWARAPVQYPSLAYILSSIHDPEPSLAKIKAAADTFWDDTIGASRHELTFFCKDSGAVRDRPRYHEQFKYPFQFNTPVFFRTWRKIVLSWAGIPDVTKGGNGQSYGSYGNRLREAIEVPVEFAPLYCDLNLILFREHPDWMALACLMLNVDYYDSLEQAEILCMPEHDPFASPRTIQSSKKVTPVVK